MPGFYHNTGGFFQRLHPAAKTVALLLAFVPPFLMEGMTPLVAYLAVLFLCVLATGGGDNLRRLMSVMTVLVVMSVLLWSVLNRGGTPWFAVGPFTVYRESVAYGVVAGGRLLCFILAAVAFLSSTPVEDVTYAVARLGVPYPVAFALGLAFRLTDLFLDTAGQIAMAQRARGLDLDKGGPLTRLRRHVPIVVPVLANGIRRADRLAMALETRGFGRRGRRSSLAEHRVTWRDLLLLTTQLLLLAAMLGARR